MMHDDIWCTVGTHPHEAKENPQLTPETLIEMAARDRVVGVGETGLDYHYDFSPRDQQQRVFQAHIEAARETGLPLVVHSREADEDMSQMLEEAHAKGKFKLLLHCYTSGPELARRAAALGAWFSVSGIATFKAAEDVRVVIRDMPADRIIVETDCPYLAPVPMRGRRNEPALSPSRSGEIGGGESVELDRGRGAHGSGVFRPVRQDTAPVSGALVFTILGCGSSGGVPRADGDWGVCNPRDPKNRRSRCSLLVRRKSQGDSNNGDDDLSRYVARFTHANGRNGREASGRCALHPRSCGSGARYRRSAGLRDRRAPPHPLLHGPRRPWPA